MGRSPGWWPAGRAALPDRELQQPHGFLLGLRRQHPGGLARAGLEAGHGHARPGPVPSSTPTTRRWTTSGSGSTAPSTTTSPPASWSCCPGGASGPGVATKVVNSLLTLDDEEFNQGLDWTTLLAGLSDKSHAIAYTTYLDGQSTKNTTELEDPADFLAGLVATDHLAGLGGENHGHPHRGGHEAHPDPGQGPEPQGRGLDERARAWSAPPAPSPPWPPSSSRPPPSWVDLASARARHPRRHVGPRSGTCWAARRSWSRCGRCGCRSVRRCRR